MDVENLLRKEPVSYGFARSTRAPEDGANQQRIRVHMKGRHRQIEPEEGIGAGGQATSSMGVITSRGGRAEPINIFSGSSGPDNEDGGDDKDDGFKGDAAGNGDEEV